MKTFCKYLASLMLTLGVSVQSFAIQQNLKMTYQQDQISDNYYVQPGGVYAAPNGIFVMFDGELIQVNTISSDARGLFVSGTEMSRQFVWCPICQRWYDPDQPHICR